jgi:group II intron reverse transcriptase/maturase
MEASWILQSIYEADFSERSVGYRRGVPGPRQCSYQLTRELFSGEYRWVVEADIRSFFEDVDHDWLLRMLEQRINDRSFLRLITKWLKAGVLEAEEDNRWEESVSGTPQGGNISPILANIYLHYVLDIWLEKRVRKGLGGKMLWMRFADDFIVCFERKCEAQEFLAVLGDRLGKFCLTLAEEKSGLVKFNRWEPDDSGKFTFLGFDFYWSRTRKNREHKMVKRRTSKKKFRAALGGMKDWIRTNRHRGLDWILERLRAKLQGHWNYYGVIGNSSRIRRYEAKVKELVFKWLNRRSQRQSITWSELLERWSGVWRLPPAVLPESKDPRCQWRNQQRRLAL